MPYTRPQCFVKGAYYPCDSWAYLQFNDGSIWCYGPMYLNEFLILANNACKGCYFNLAWRPRLAAGRVSAFPPPHNEYEEVVTFETGQPVRAGKNVPANAADCLFYEGNAFVTCPVDETAPENCGTCDAFVALPFNFGNVES